MTAYSAELVAPTGVEQPEEPQPIETPADTRAPAPAVPSADPTTPHPPLQQSRGLPYPFPSTELYLTLCRH
ncbi:hypothetical protein AAG906_018743 [Vitis piasezkii]